MYISAKSKGGEITLEYQGADLSPENAVAVKKWLHECADKLEEERSKQLASLVCLGGFQLGQEEIKETS